MTFVNEYDYTPAFIRMSVKAALWRQYRLYVLILSAAALLFAALASYFRYPLLLLLTAVLLVDLALLWVKCRRAEKTEAARLQVLYKDGAPRLRIVVTDEAVTMEAPDVTRTIAYADAVDLYETSELMVLRLKGRMTVPMKKDSFTQGTAEGCAAFLQKKLAAVRTAAKK